MPRKDIIHDAVKNALIKDGWTVTHDPYELNYGRQELYVDLAAERRLLAAERANEKIAVEIKSFIRRSTLNDLQNALGQYAMYLSIMEVVDAERRLCLAVSDTVYDALNAMETFHYSSSSLWYGACCGAIGR